MKPKHFAANGAPSKKSTRSRTDGRSSIVGAKRGSRKRLLDEWFENPPSWQDVQGIREEMRRLSNSKAIKQIWRTISPGDAEADLGGQRLAEVAFYQTLLPSDGIESSLSRLLIAATNGAMDCFSRAAALDMPARLVDAQLGAKLSLVVVALSRALDSHRAHDLPLYIDDTVESEVDGDSGKSGGDEPDEHEPSFEKCSASEHQSTHVKK